DPAFAVVIGTHNHHDVFKADGKHHAPENQGQDAEYRSFANGEVCGEEALAQCIERTGTNISENDPKRSQCNHRESCLLCSALHILSSFLTSIFANHSTALKVFLQINCFSLAQLVFFAIILGLW